MSVVSVGLKNNCHPASLARGMTKFLVWRFFCYSGVMKKRLLTTALLFTACATQIQAELPVGINPTSTAPMSKAEASFYAARMAARSGEKTSCLRDDLVRKSKLDVFATHIENHIKCGGYDNPRAEVISLMEDTTIRFCEGPPYPILRPRTCWDGSFFDTSNPCFKCPPEPVK